MPISDSWLVRAVPWISIANWRKSDKGESVVVIAHLVVRPVRVPATTCAVPN